MILSTKSAGSTAVQQLLVDGGGRTVTWTAHQENETLYWTKAASILGLPQAKMADSVVPYSPQEAETLLRRFLAANVPTLHQPSAPDCLVAEGWRALVGEYGPVFVEKSPHHLHQWSALDLALSVNRAMPEIDLQVVGLVRDPMDTLHSMWRRWRYRPSVHQFEWATAYENLLRLVREVPGQVHIVRYEDLASEPGAAESLGAFLGLQIDSESLNASSVGRWRKDPSWGHVLDTRVAKVASSFGYGPWPEPSVLSRASWLIRRELAIALRGVRRTLGAFIRRLDHTARQTR